MIYPVEQVRTVIYGVPVGLAELLAAVEQAKVQVATPVEH